MHGSAVTIMACHCSILTQSAKALVERCYITVWHYRN